MNELKRAVAEAVQELVQGLNYDSSLGIRIEEAAGGGNAKVEVINESDLMTRIKVWEKDGPPRHFLVRVQEQS